jgi:hypothetical protein
MCLRGVIEPATLVLESIAAEQPSVAFEPSALAGGESCRDPIGPHRGAGLDAEDTAFPSLPEARAAALFYSDGREKLHPS